MPNIQSLTSAIGSYTSARKSDAYLIELGSDDRPVASGGKPTQLAFQYFPDTVSDTKAVNYQQKEIPGGSLPLYQWINGGERVVSFTAYFSSDVDLLSAGSANTLTQLATGAQNITDRLRSAGEARHNVDIRSAVTWLRRYMLPTYVSDDKSGGQIGVPFTLAPSKLRLVMPGSGIGLAGGDISLDSVLCVMTQCDVNYEKFFPSGLPRVASVSLSFAQVAQQGGSVVFPQRGTVMDSNILATGTSSPNSFFGYTLNPRTKNGGT